VSSLVTVRQHKRLFSAIHGLHDGSGNKIIQGKTYESKIKAIKLE